MDNVNQMLIKLIVSEIGEKPLSLPADFSFSERFLLELYSAAQRHSVQNIIAAALINNDILENSPLKPHFENELYKCVFTHEKMNSAYESFCAELEKERINYIPLKGAVVRELYPQPWLRSSCDIDILISEDDLERAVDKFIGAYSLVSKGIHDVVLKSEDGVLIELHFNLLGNKKSPVYSEFLENPWRYAELCETGKFCFRFSDEMFYYYHIVHMAKHFRLGGCGLRPFIDLWLMMQDKKYDSPKINSMLKKGKLSDFNSSARKLCSVWFLGEKHDDTTALMQDFIIDGGNFGSKETRLLSEQQRSGNKFKYIFSRIFLPYDELKNHYPILKKHPVFTPFCEICRFFSLLFGKKRSLRKSRVENVKNVSSKRINDINLLFERVGLN